MVSHLRPVPQVAPRAVLYLRQSVSRDDSISMELQEIAGKDYCAAQGYEIVAIERDEGLSGRNWSKRPAVQRALELVESKQAEIIVLWKWSRLSRSRTDWALAADRVDVAGGRIESATEPIDTATASGRFARGVMTEYAAFQSEQIGEQWEEVRQRRFNNGLPPSGALPWGWVSKRTHIEPVLPEADHVRTMYEMYVTGKGFTAIAGWLNRTGIKPRRGKDWISASVRKILDSPIHAGYIIYRGEIRKGNHDGIISQEMWEHYQMLRHKRHIPVKIRQSNYLMSSLMMCHCGRKLYGRKWKNTAGKTHYSYTCPTTTGHKTQSRKMELIHEAIGEWIKTLASDVTSDTSIKPVQSVDVEALAREVTAIEKRMVKLTEHLVSGLVPERVYKQTRDQLSEQSSKLQRELDKAQRSPTLTKDVLLRGNEDLISAWDTIDLETKQQVVRSFVARCVLNEDKTITVYSAWGETSVINT